MSEYGTNWEANYAFDPTGQTGTLYLFARSPNGSTVVVTAIDRYAATMERVEAGVAVDGGLRFTYEMLKAIADHINPPGEASKGEIARLEEALQHERQRIDNILDRWVPER